MKTAVAIGTFASIEKAAASLIGAIASHGRNLVDAVSESRKVGYRWEAEIPDTEPLAWLNHHDNLIRMYCSNRERRLQIAAVGCADMLRYKDEDTNPRQALDYVFSCLHQLPEGTRYYGGMRFHETQTDDDHTWKRFGHVRFVLPSVELIRDEKKTILVANLVQSPEIKRDVAILLATLNKLETPPPLAAAHLPLPINRINTPDRELWDAMVLRALKFLKDGELQKIVLARRCSFDFNEQLHPMALLQRLHEASPDSFHFCFNYGNEIAFIGATPERLYQRIGTKITSEALAGTRPRGATDEDDQWLESELLASAKERKEHRLVTDSIVETLKDFCVSLVAGDEPEILKLRYVQHLRTVISGELREPVSDTDILLALHPTPAIGGSPTEAATRHICELEPFDRGWYTAPIGWATRDQAEFAVAIRCALVEGSRLSLFSGAGIMPESDPEQEWREIESKIGNFLRILTT
ncbi:MAG TPA: isochorismate synthase [Kiritimatiellia bacterium]|nr:isochorismate synthase [Kiritimatiellia bacterium]